MARSPSSAILIPGGSCVPAEILYTWVEFGGPPKPARRLATESKVDIPDGVGGSSGPTLTGSATAPGTKSPGLGRGVCPPCCAAGPSGDLPEAYKSFCMETSFAGAANSSFIIHLFPPLLSPRAQTAPYQRRCQASRHGSRSLTRHSNPGKTSSPVTVAVSCSKRPSSGVR